MGIFDSDSALSRYKARNGIRISKSTDLKQYIELSKWTKVLYNLIDLEYKDFDEDTLIEIKDIARKILKKHNNLEEFTIIEIEIIIEEAVKKIKT